MWHDCNEHEAPFGLGSTPTLHRGQWYMRRYSRSGLGKRTLRWGFGANPLPNPQSEPVIEYANRVLAYFAVNPCTQAQIPDVGLFQAAYNGSGLPGQLTQDSQYGGNTQRALQNVMQKAQNDAGGGPAEAAPQNCFGMAVPDIPALDAVNPAPAPGGNATPVSPSQSVVVNNTTPSNSTMLLVGAVVLGGAFLGYTYLKKHRGGPRGHSRHMRHAHA